MVKHRRLHSRKHPRLEIRVQLELLALNISIIFNIYRQAETVIESLRMRLGSTRYKSRQVA